MPIDEKNFLDRIGSKKPAGYGDSVAGETPEEEASPGEETDEGMTCGEQLLAGINNNDASMIDAALKEAVAKYGK